MEKSDLCETIETIEAIERIIIKLKDSVKNDDDDFQTARILLFITAILLNDVEECILEKK